MTRLGQIHMLSRHIRVCIVLRMIRITAVCVKLLYGTDSWLVHKSVRFARLLGLRSLIDAVFACVVTQIDARDFTDHVVVARRPS